MTSRRSNNLGFSFVDLAGLRGPITIVPMALRSVGFSAQKIVFSPLAGCIQLLQVAWCSCYWVFRESSQGRSLWALRSICGFRELHRGPLRRESADVCPVWLRLCIQASTDLTSTGNKIPQCELQSGSGDNRKPLYFWKRCGCDHASARSVFFPVANTYN